MILPMLRPGAALALVLALAAFVSTARPAGAQTAAPVPAATGSPAAPPVLNPATPATRTLEKIFVETPLDPSLFAPNFVTQIPVSDVAAFVGSYVVRLGAPTAIAAAGYEYQITSPKGSIKVNIAFDQTGKVTSLLFHDELSDQNYHALERLLSSDAIAPEWFMPSYVKDVPTNKTVTLLADLHASLGKLVRIDTQNGTYVAVFERGKSHVQISTDIDGKIDYFALSKPS